MGTVAIVTPAAAERRIVQAFRRAGATTPDAARSLAELGLRTHRSIERLERSEVLRATSPGRYYLDERELDEYVRMRRRRAVVAVVVALASALAVALWNRPGH